jgi:hypothetical protein
MRLRELGVAHEDEVEDQDRYREAGPALQRMRRADKMFRAWARDMAGKMREV